MKKVKSVRGELVDFDLIQIKEQMASAPPPSDVRHRQDFIESRMRRRARKATPVVKATPVETDEVTEPVVEQTVMIEANEPVVEKKTTRQKARPKAKTDTDKTDQGE